MIKETVAEKILEYISAHGGDFGEVFSEETSYTRLLRAGGKLESIAEGRDCGTGIRIFIGGTVLYFSESSCREERLFQLLKENLCAEKLKALREKAVCGGISEVPPQTAMCQRKSAEKTAYKTAGLREKAALLKRCEQAGLSTDRKIIRMNVKYTDDCQTVYIANTEGLSAYDERVKTRLHITAFAENGKELRTSYRGPGAKRGFEFYSLFDPEALSRQIASDAVKLLGSKKCPAGRMPVIIGNGFGGLFFHEACGHSLEASAVLDGASEFSGRLGERVASEKVTLIDDGTLPYGWGSYQMDDEGVAAQKNVLIENGVLKSYLTDRMNAKKLGLSPNGSGRRQNYRFAPVSRMTNTYIAGGTDEPSAMIASVKQGLYVKSINAGSVNPATGEFNFNTGEAFLIENGEITYPVNNATLIGTGGEILKKVEMVGNDFALGQGFCYAESGTLYIGAGQPTIKISEMTVGGNKV